MYQSMRNRSPPFSHPARLFHYGISSSREGSNGPRAIVLWNNRRGVLLATVSPNCAGLFCVCCNRLGPRPRRNSPKLAMAVDRNGELDDRVGESVAVDHFAFVVGLCAGTVLSFLAAAD